MGKSINMPVGDNTQNQSNSATQPPKKEKTEAQREKERIRRKRRRQNKQKNTGLKPGADVPLVLSEQEAEQANIQPTEDLSLSEERGLADDVAPPADYDPLRDNDEPMAPVVPPAPEVLPPSDLEESQQIFEEGVPLANESVSASEPESETEIEPQPETEGQSEDELAPAYETQSEPQSEPESAQNFVPESEVPSFVEPEVVEQEELDLHQAKLQQAEQLAKTLQDDGGDTLEEVPQKQGLFGKLFDLIQGLIQGREQTELDQSQLAGRVEKQEPQVVEVMGEEAPKKNALGSVLKFFVGVVVVVVLVVAAFWLGSSLKVMDVINSWLAPNPSGLELVVGDNSKVILDQSLLEKWGFETGRLAGKNLGNVNDLAYNVFFNANFFGQLKDPMSITETGMTAAIFYGFGREAQFFENKFVFYVKYLDQIRNSNQVKISDVLDKKVRRDEALDDFVDGTSKLFEEGNGYRKEIAVQVDDLKISINSLNPDKDRYEIDFFAALEATQAEKADALIQNFVETTQTQVELKAKLAAMTKLYEYYELELIDMKLRLDAIAKNREALISGVSVTETPGVDLNLIRQ